MAGQWNGFATETLLARDNQKKREAASKVSMKRVMDAVQYVPKQTAMSTSDQIFDSLEIRSILVHRVLCLFAVV